MIFLWHDCVRLRCVIARTIVSCRCAHSVFFSCKDHSTKITSQFCYSNPLLSPQSLMRVARIAYGANLDYFWRKYSSTLYSKILCTIGCTHLGRTIAGCHWARHVLSSLVFSNAISFDFLHGLISNSRSTEHHLKIFILGYGVHGVESKKVSLIVNQLQIETILQTYRRFCTLH